MYGVSEQFLREVTTSHRAVSWVEILGEDTNIDGITSGSVTLDGAALIVGSFSLTIEDPLGTYLDTGSPGDILSKYGSEVRPWRGVQYRDGTIEAVPLGTFRVEVNDPTEVGTGFQLSITGRDRSSIVSRPAPRPIAIAKGTPVHEAIATLVSALYPQAQFDLLVTPYTTGVILVEVGGDAWAEAVNLAAESGLTLHTDRWGRFVTREALSPAEQAVWAFTDGETSTLTEVPTVRTSAEPTPNGYIVMSSNTGTDSADVAGEAWDLDPSSPTYRYGRYGEVVKIVQSDKVTTSAQCTAAANLMMRQSVGAASEIDFSSIVNPALDPWDVVWVRRPQVGVDGAFYAASLQIPLSAAETMGGSLRKHLTMDEFVIDSLIQDFLAPAPQAPETPGSDGGGGGGGGESGGGGGTTDPADPPTSTTGGPTKPGDDYTKPHPHTWPPKGDGTKPTPNNWKPPGRGPGK